MIDCLFGKPALSLRWQVRPTGDSGVLIFQPRRQGEGLWQSIELPNGGYGVQLATEAAEGILTYEAGQYAWEENPD